MHIQYLFIADREQLMGTAHLCDSPVWAAAAPGEGCSPVSSFCCWVWSPSVSAAVPGCARPGSAQLQSAPPGPPEHAAPQLIWTLPRTKYRQIDRYMHKCVHQRSATHTHTQYPRSQRHTFPTWKHFSPDSHLQKVWLSTALLIIIYNKLSLA